MVRIRITAPCTTAQLSLEPGDEILVAKITPEIERLLNARRIDNEPVAELVRGDERSEKAITRPRKQEVTTA